jgi:membrane associated rhomboid family serine protease
MNIIEEIKYQAKYGNAITKIIFVNAMVFVLLFVGNLILKFGFNNAINLNSIVAVPTSFKELLNHPWTIITYQFSDFHFIHFLFNSIGLYFIGQLFFDFYKQNEAWKIYILGGITGAFIFIAVTSLVPGFKNSLLLIGSSASLYAIFFATATYAPYFRINLFGVIPTKLMWLALAFLFLDVLSLLGTNPGGHLAHIGGAIFGFIYAKFKQGQIQVKLFEPMIVQKPIEKKFTVEVNHQYNRQNQNTPPKTDRKPSQDEVDAILDKINLYGYDRLSKEEKDLLFKASQD